MTSSHSGSADPQRRARFEAFEERLAFSGQALDSFAVDPFEAPELQAQYQEIAPAIQDVDLNAQVYGLTNRYGLTGSNQTVVVIDSGIAYDHVALGGGYGSNYRVVGGWDFAENDANPYDDGPAGFHGTHVAGIIGSSNSTYQGVASGVDLVALRVFNDQGAGQLSWVEQALRWVHANRGNFENPITTVNLSLGTTWNSTTVPNWASLEDEFQQLEQDGIFISVAAGNSFQSYLTPGLSYPAASPFVVPVASHGASGQLSSFSQRASNVLVAPGESIMSTVPDHLWGSNAQSTRFLAASGTSMAAPYVAGASVLVRQAMETIGYQNINQDQIEAHFRATADVIYDSVTNANYYKVNLQRALDALMGDDYGDTVGDAHSLGTINTTAEVSGYINGVNDDDAFSFVAGRTGRMSLTLDDAAGMSGRLSVPGVSTTTSGGVVSFDVVAGQSYHILVDSTSGAGSYTLGLDLESVPWTTPPTDQGVVDSTLFEGLNVAGETWLRVQASNTGYLTLQALTENRGAGFRIDLFNDDVQSLGGTSGARVDVQVRAGETYLIRVQGNVADLDLQATNLVGLAGNRLTIAGTSGDDAMSLSAGSQLAVQVNGVSYSFSNSQVRSITVSGGSGNDSLQLVGNSQRDVMRLSVGSANWDRSTFGMSATGFEEISAASGGGNDSLVLTGTAGDDTLVANGSLATLSNADGTTVASGFGTFVAYGGGGEDSATLSGSTGNDRFWARSHNATLYASNFRQFLADFDHIEIDASQGGSDIVYLSDSTGSDVATLAPRDASISADDYSIQATGFGTQYIYSTRGGNDQVTFEDSAGADRFFASSTAADLRGTGYYSYASGFSTVIANSSGHAGDSATLRDSSGVDSLDASFASTTLSGARFSNEARGFASVYAYGGTAGRTDNAVFRDSVTDDRFYYSRDYSSLRTDGWVVGAYGFRNAQAIAGAGGTDLALVYGTSGVDRVITSAQNNMALVGTNYRAAALGFTDTQVFGNGGRDVAVFEDLDEESELMGTGRLAQVNYGDLQTVLRDFAYIQAMIGDDRPTADIAAVDFLFELLERKS